MRDFLFVGGLGVEVCRGRVWLTSWAGVVQPCACVTMASPRLSVVALVPVTSVTLSPVVVAPSSLITKGPQHQSTSTHTSILLKMPQTKCYVYIG